MPSAHPRSFATPSTTSITAHTPARFRWFWAIKKVLSLLILHRAWKHTIGSYRPGTSRNVATLTLLRKIWIEIGNYLHKNRAFEALAHLETINGTSVHKT